MSAELNNKRMVQNKSWKLAAVLCIDSKKNWVTVLIESNRVFTKDSPKNHSVSLINGSRTKFEVFIVKVWFSAKF